MAAASASSLQIAADFKPSLFSAGRIIRAGVASVGIDHQGASCSKLSSACHISTGQLFHRTFTSSPSKFNEVITKAMSEAGENKPYPGLPINLKGYVFAFVS